MLQTGERLLSAKGEDWAGKARIVACSLDEDMATPRDFLAQVSAERGESPLGTLAFVLTGRVSHRRSLIRGSWSTSGFPAQTTMRPGALAVGAWARPRGKGECGRASPCSPRCTALPMAAIVVRGTIAWRGHIDDIDLSATVDALVAGGDAVVVREGPVCLGMRT